jgi:hypothetical protein
MRCTAVTLRMGADGACSVLFCAAKGSGAFSSNMPAGLRARESRLGGFTRPLSGLLFPPAGAPALRHYGRGGYQPPSPVPHPDGVVVCTV